MKKVLGIIFILLFMATSVNAECGGKEWELGSAIQVTPTGSTNPKDWPLWKAKLGVCIGDQVEFSQQCYFNTKPSSQDLTGCFNKTVHSDIWYIVPEKERTFYVFQSDWNVWYKALQGKLATMSAINFLLLKAPERQSGPGNLAYTPDKPSPTSENEGILTLSQNAWQRMYAIGEMYVRIQVRDDGAKMKFGQRINANQVKFFDVRYQIPVSENWYLGSTPFSLADMFPGYIFKDQSYPGDNVDVWTAQVFVPGYKHIAWTPNNPNPDAFGESDIILSGSSWQNVYPVGVTFCQVDLRSNNTFKVKFGIVRNGYVEIFNLLRDIPVPDGWVSGQVPMNLPITFPEYQFGSGFDPDGSTVWTAQVWIPGYNL